MASILDQLLRDVGKKLPNNVGEAYDKASKLGSWVSAGINAYKSASQEFDALKRYLKRWGNLGEDPTVLFYTLNNLLRSNPVKLPDHMSGQDYNLLKTLFSKLYGSSNTKTGPFTSHDINYSVNIPNNSVGGANGMDGIGAAIYLDPLNYIPGGNYRNVNNSVVTADIDQSYSPNEVKYNNQSDPYGRVTNPSSISPKSIVEELNKAGFGIGYDYVRGFEIGDYSLWNIQLYPYRTNPMPPNYNIDWKVDLPEGRANYCLVPELPYYSLPDITNTETGYSVYYLGMYLPVLNWNLNYGQLGSETIPLFNNSSFSVLKGFNYSMVLSLTILDDVYHSVEKYFTSYINSVYDIEKGLMAPYWASSFIIQLTTFRPGYQINSCHRLIGYPVNWAPTIDGSTSPDESKVQLDFSIIGCIQYTNNEELNKVYPKGLTGDNNLSELTWDKITLRQNKVSK